MKRHIWQIGNIWLVSHFTSVIDQEILSNSTAARRRRGPKKTRGPKPTLSSQKGNSGLLKLLKNSLSLRNERMNSSPISRYLPRNLWHPFQSRQLPSFRRLNESKASQGTLSQKYVFLLLQQYSQKRYPRPHFPTRVVFPQVREIHLFRDPAIALPLQAAALHTQNTAFSFLPGPLANIFGFPSFKIILNLHYKTKTRKPMLAGRLLLFLGIHCAI